MAVGSRQLGKLFIVKSAFGMTVFSTFLQIFAPLRNVTNEYLLAVCFGGVLLGVGVGLVIRFGGCLDGTETVAILLNKKFVTIQNNKIIVYLHKRNFEISNSRHADERNTNWSYDMLSRDTKIAS